MHCSLTDALLFHRCTAVSEVHSCVRDVQLFERCAFSEMHRCFTDVLLFQRCALLEALLRRSNYTQFQFLFTVMQPSLHRDFMYTAHTRFPDIEFKPISTHISRELKV